MRICVLILGWVLLGLAASGCQKPVTSATLAAQEKKYPELRKNYVYQSLIRLANVKHDPNFEKLIRDVNKIILYLPPDGDSTYQISGLQQGLQKEGYETLIEVRTAEAQRISLWSKESGKQTHYIALIDAPKEDIILEVDGQINIQYLTSIQLADQSSLKNLLEGGF